MSPNEDELLAMIDALSSVQDELDRVRRQSKNSGRLSLLRIVADHNGIQPSAIAERQQLHVSQITRRVRECRSAGLVDVARDPADLRATIVTLTPAGADELSRLNDSSVHRFRKVVYDWEPDEIRRLTVLLEKLERSIVAASGRQRRSRGGSTPRDHGQPDWLIDLLGH